MPTASTISLDSQNFYFRKKTVNTDRGDSEKDLVFITYYYYFIMNFNYENPRVIKFKTEGSLRDHWVYPSQFINEERAFQFINEVTCWRPPSNGGHFQTMQTGAPEAAAPKFYCAVNTDISGDTLGCPWNPARSVRMCCCGMFF